MQNVLIIGGGIVGVTSAWALCQKGYQVTLLETHNDLATEASATNACQLQYSDLGPMAYPGALATYASYLVHPHRPSRLRLLQSPYLIAWLWLLWRASDKATTQANRHTLLNLGAESMQVMQSIMQQTGIEFTHNTNGRLHLFADAQTQDTYLKKVADLPRHGFHFESLTLAQCQQREPALAHLGLDYHGAIYFPEGHSGNSRIFSQQLAAWLTNHASLTVLNNTPATRLYSRDGRVLVSTPKGELGADHIVVANGWQARALLKPLGINVPLYPLKGYGLTLPNTINLQHSISDQTRLLAGAPLGERLRISGMGDLDGSLAAATPGRVAHLKKLAGEFLPALSPHLPEAVVTHGMRPCTPDGLPIIGATKYKNLWLNLGHGRYGWTLAAATAAQLAKTIK